MILPGGLLTRRTILSGALAATAAATSAGRSAAQTPRAVTIASLLADDKPETRVWVRFRALVNAKLPGRFDLRITPNAALGGEREVAEGTRLGSIHGSLTTLAALSAWVPDGQVFDLPFVFRDRPHIARASAGPVGRELIGKYNSQGFHVLAYINYGARHLLAHEALTKPAQLAGKRIRVIQSPLHAELWKAFGANPTPIPITETYNALKSGVVDLMDLTIPAYVGFKLHEVVPYVIQTGHIWSVGALFLAGKFWESLSADEKAVFSEAGLAAAAHFDTLMVEDEEASAGKARASGVTFVEPADRRDWETIARPVREAFAARIGAADKVKALVES
jgi:tripartite ATP-independent transporter DctP family solute receptor